MLDGLRNSTIFNAYIILTFRLLTAQPPSQIDVGITRSRRNRKGTRTR
jgi:hypothetical protein